MIVGFLYNVHAIRLVLAPVCYIFCLPYRRSWCDTITHWLDMVHCSPAPWCRFCQQASISATEALISPIATFQSSSMTVDYIATLWFAPQGFVPLIFYNGYLFDSHTSIDVARLSIWDIRYQPHKFLFHYTIFYVSVDPFFLPNIVLHHEAKIHIDNIGIILIIELLLFFL